MKLDARAQLEFPRQVVERFPRQREAGFQTRLRIHRDQSLEHVLGDVAVGREVVKVGIDRSHVGAERDTQIGGGGGGGAEQQRNSGNDP